MPSSRATLSRALCLITLFAASSVAAQTIWYVDDGAPLGGDGQSWLAPYSFLQDALSAAAGGDQIRIAGGIHMPDRDTAHPGGSGDRHATFQLKNGVALYGGYAGFGAADPDARDTVLFETVLSGDLSGNDVAADFPYGASHLENSYHVVTGSGTDGTAVLDGLVITAGHADDFVDFPSGVGPDACGGGMYSLTGSPTLHDCVFRGNFAYGGSGMYNKTASSPSVVDVTFRKNWSGGDAAGMHNEDGSCPILNGCVFSENYQHIENTGYVGFGTLYCGNSCDATVLDCTFTDNVADVAGAMMCDNSSPQVHGCSFARNTATASGGWGGGGIVCYHSGLLMTGCTIVDNTSSAWGGGVYCDRYSSLTLTDCTIGRNKASRSRGGGVYCDGSVSLTMNNCTVEENVASSGGGVYCLNLNPTLTNCTLSGNTATGGSLGYGGGLYSSSPSPSTGPVLTGCTISGNTAAASGGGVYFSYSNPKLTNCTIKGNKTAKDGGGVYCDSYSSGSGPVLTGCTISRNSTGAGNGRGGGMYFGGSANTKFTNCIINANQAASGGGAYCEPELTMINCTLGGNTATYQGGGLYCNYAAMTLTNCILWGNTAPSGNQGYLNSSGAISTVSYSNVQNAQAGFGVLSGTPNWGSGNLNADPGFALSEDFHLMPGSVCIDAGTNSPTGGLPTADADGNPRRLDGNGDGVAVADMGAYEFNRAVPAIAVSPSRIVWSVPQGQAATEPKTLSIRNAGGGTLHWTLDWDGSWLQADVVQGQSTGEIDPVTLTADVSTLSHGTYKTTLVVVDPQASNHSRLVEVMLNVTSLLYVPGEYATIQAAIDAAGPGDTIEVADGTYSGAGNKDLDYHGKDITVHSAGGNPATCIIDCQGSGRGFYFHNMETNAAVVSGFTIRNGNVTTTSPGGSYGAGVYCSGSDPTLTNCTITGNTVTGTNGYGGGMSCSGSSPRLTNCTITENTVTATSSGSGGGVYGTGSNATLTDCTITGNTVTGTYGYGGGVYCSGPTPTLANCTITGNTVTAASSGRGAGVYCAAPSAKLTNCAITGNTVTATASGCGGGIYYTSSNAQMTDCSITGNMVTGSSSGYGGGMYCTGSNPTMTNCTITGNTVTATSSGYGGAMYCAVSSPKLTNCSITGNTVTATSSGYGGGIYCGSSPKLTNCTITGNAVTGSLSGYGGGMYCTGSYATLTNCTMTGNTVAATSSSYGGGLYCTSSSPKLTNCILWGDTPQEIYLSTSSYTPVVTYSDIQGGYTGAGNINLDPRFVNAVAGNFHLAADSPCIDSGSNAGVPSGIITDIDGDPRILPGHPLHMTLPPPGHPLPPAPPPVVDMGADEFKPAPLPEPEEVPIGPAPIAQPAAPPSVRHR